MNFIRRKGQIAPRDTSSNSSLAFSSSNVAAEVDESPLNDAASIKAKFKKLFHRDKRDHIDTTGDVVATSGNKTANAAAILGIVQAICEVLDKVPYVKVVTGLATTAITIIEAVNACKEEWDKVKGDLSKVRDIVLKFRYGRDDSAPLPDDVKDTFQELEICLRDVLDAVIRYRDVSAGRLVLERSALKAEATSCVGRIDMAVKVFQMNILIGTRLVGDQTHHIVEKILTIVLSIQQGPTPSPSLNLNVLACPAPSQYFTGRESDLRKLSRMLALPVVTLFSTSSNALSAFIHSFDHLSRFTAIFLDASSVEALSMGLKVIVHNIKANNSACRPPLLVLENADPSLELDQYLPYSLHNPILVTSTNQTVSRFASARDYKFELPDSMDQQAADSLHRSIERAFGPLLHVVTIVARGGTGKTQLVLRFVSEDLSRFMHIWFFDATSDATLAADFKKLGKASGIGELVNDVRDFLGRMQEDWLLIFDNADDPKVELSKYIPRCNHGNIIITSRLTEVNQMASPGAHLDFFDLEQSEAVYLLLKHAHQDLDNDNQQIASDIVNALGCQALAVATAGAYIVSNPTCTLSNYLSHFNQKHTELLNYKMRSLDDYQKTVFSAFRLSFDQLSSPTKLFMQICAFFYHTAIPVELFYRAATFTGDDLQPEEKEKTPAIEELEYFLSHFKHEGSWNNSINELSHFSLIIYSTGDKVISFHPILHICIQETITNKNKAYHTAMLLLARATSNDDTNINYQFQRLLIAHADCIYQNNPFTFLVYNCLVDIFSYAGLWIKSKSVQQKTLMYCEHYFGKHHLNTLRSRSILAGIYMQCGQLEEAEMLGKEILKLHKEVLGEHHPSTLTSMGSLALIYRELGQFKEAKILEEETLKLCKEVLGEHHSSTLKSMSNLASIYHKLGQSKKAEILEKETLKFCKEVLGERHPSTLTSMGNLALIYQELGQLKEAEILQNETLKLHKEMLGERHPRTLIAISNLAVIYHKLGQLKEAEMLQTKTLKLRKELFGESHPSTLKSMGNLASIYQELGQLKEAEMLEKETLKLRKKVLGEHHPDILISMENLTLIYRKLGQLKEAEILQKETLKLHKEVLGEHHPDTLVSMGILALIYQELEQLKEAEILEKETLKLRKEVLGEHHPDTLVSMGNLALIYQKLGQLKEAEILEKETLKLRKKLLGECHPNTLISMSNLAVIYQRLGQLKEAEMLQKETLKLHNKVFGECHPSTLISMGNLGLIYQELGQLKEAEMLQKETLKLHKKVLGDRHPGTLISMGNLALTYQELGQLKEAKILEKETLKLCKEVLGEHHSSTLKSMSNLIVIYQKLGQLKKAEMLQKKKSLQAST